MTNAVILDFMGVIADFDCMQLIADTPLNDKLVSGKLIFRLTKKLELKKIFNMYKSGKITQSELITLLAGNDKQLKSIIANILKRIPDYITPNEKVIDLMRELKSCGTKVIILSNTIPETEYVIKKFKLEDLCDDVVCSTQVGITKPDAKIFEYVIQKNNLDPIRTVYIDDSKKNLIAAEKFGIQTEIVKGSEETASILDDYKFYIDFINSCSSENIFY